MRTGIPQYMIPKMVAAYKADADIKALAAEADVDPVLAEKIITGTIEAEERREAARKKAEAEAAEAPKRRGRPPKTENDEG